MHREGLAMVLEGLGIVGVKLASVIWTSDVVEGEIRADLAQLKRQTWTVQQTWRI